MKPHVTVTAALLTALVVPTSAHAGAIHLTGTSGPASEIFPLYRADPGERNEVTVTLGPKGVTIVDTGVRFIRAETRKHPLCRRRGPRKFFCAHNRFVDVRLGDRDDALHFKSASRGEAPTTTNPVALAEPDVRDSEGAPDARAFVHGGEGRDTIVGSSFADDIWPGSGRDSVSARGGRDTIVVGNDHAKDALRGEGGIDSVDFDRKAPVTVDLATGTGAGDKLAGIERVRGTDASDTLLGSARSDALYGGAGPDSIDGRGGNDLLVTDNDFGKGSGNGVSGGDGDDVIDALGGGSAAPRSSFDCGAGADRVASGVGDLLPASCESAVYVIVSELSFYDGPIFDAPVQAAPVASDAEGPTFRIPCLPEKSEASSGCKGTVELESPPVGGSNAQPASYGSGSFDLKPGESADVKVPLNAAGQAARANDTPVAVHVTVTLPRPMFPSSPLNADFGWQLILPR